MIHIEPICAFTDNYIWLIHDGKFASVVDPGEENGVLHFLEKNDLTLKSILITHHHHDHTGAVSTLVQKTGAQVYGSSQSHIEGIDHYVQEGDEIDLSPLALSLKVIEVPGHTLDHVAFYGSLPSGQGVLFCGDTLFSCGSGRLFEGNPTQMLFSLEKIKEMEDNTLIYCAHEYTLSNIRWALQVDPTNLDLKAWQDKALALRDRQEPTIPTELALERKINPFLRVDQALVREAVQRYAERELFSTDEVLAFLRQWKNNF